MLISIDLSDQIVVTSAENASIRIWRFEESDKSEEKLAI